MVSFSPFGRYGGKQRIARKIVPLLPPHDKYVEPFAGGAAVLFAKGDCVSSVSDRHYIEVINDLDGDVVNVYRVLQNEQKSESLMRRLSCTPYSQSEFCRAHAIYSEHRQDGLLPADVVDADGDVERAWAFLVVVGQGFSFTMTRSWGVDLQGQTDRPRWFSGTVDRLSPFLSRLRSVYIECVDALECMRKWDSPSTLFYCDPPYVGVSPGPYPEFSQPDFDSLVSFLDSCQGSFVLSAYENDSIPLSWERFEILSSCPIPVSSSADRRRVELVFRVDRSSHASSTPIYNSAGGRALLLPFD